MQLCGDSGWGAIKGDILNIASVEPPRPICPTASFARIAAPASPVAAQPPTRTPPIASLTEHERRVDRDTVQYLMNRYGMLFEPRCLVCRRCLGVRYGADTEKERLRRQRRPGRCG